MYQRNVKLKGELLKMVIDIEKEKKEKLKIKVKLKIRSGNDCQNIELPLEERKLKADLNSLLGTDDKYEIIKIESNYDIFEDEYADLIALNKKINKLNKLAKVDEIIAVTEFFDCSSIAEVIWRIEKKDYKFVSILDLKKYIVKADLYKSDIYTSDLVNEFIKRMEYGDVFCKFNIRQVINKFSGKELLHYLKIENKGLFPMTTGLIVSKK